MNKITVVISVVIFLSALTELADGQILSDVRDQVRESLQNAHYAENSATLIAISEELELSGASYEIDDGDENLSNTKLKALSLPFRTTLFPWKESEVGIYVEGVVGYGKASQNVSDIYAGAAPGFETSVDGDWTTYGGLIGFGPEFTVHDEFRIAPIVNAGIAYIESDAEYAGPGAETSAAMFDGLAFNWDAWTASGGLALRLDWTHSLGKGYSVEIVSRYDLRWTQTIEHDDPAQEFTSRYQLFTLRSDIVGPTGLAILERTLYWRILAGYRAFMEGDLYGANHIVLLGSGLEYDINEILPIGSVLTVKGGVLIGADITGYTVGIGMTF